MWPTQITIKPSVPSSYSCYKSKKQIAVVEAVAANLAARQNKWLTFCPHSLPWLETISRYDSNELRGIPRLHEGYLA